VLSWL